MDFSSLNQDDALEKPYPTPYYKNFNQKIYRKTAHVLNPSFESVNQNTIFLPNESNQNQLKTCVPLEHQKEQLDTSKLNLDSAKTSEGISSIHDSEVVFDEVFESIPSDNSTKNKIVIKTQSDTESKTSKESSRSSSTETSSTTSSSNNSSTNKTLSKSSNGAVSSIEEEQIEEDDMNTNLSVTEEV